MNTTSITNATFGDMIMNGIYKYNKYTKFQVFFIGLFCFIYKDEWKLRFIGEKSRKVYLNLIDKVRCLISAYRQQNIDCLAILDELKKTLAIIRDRVIGNNCSKYFFMHHDLLQTLLPLLWLRDESDSRFMKLLAECQKDALTLLSVLISKNNQEDWSNLPSEEIFSNLLLLLNETTGQNVMNHIKFFEVLTKSLVCFAKKIDNIRDASFADETLPILLKLLNPNNSNPQICQNVANLLSASCDSPTKQKILVDNKCLDLILEMLDRICFVDELCRLTITDIKILDGITELLHTLTRDNIEVSVALSSTPLKAQKSVTTFFYQLLSLSSISVDLKLKISLL